MREVYPKLFIGNADDYNDTVQWLPGWRVVQACKDPYHRAAVGYTGRGASPSHPEYYTAVRGNRLVLNLIDAPTAALIPPVVIDTALTFMHASLREDFSVLVHCNAGVSRAPSLGLLYLAAQTTVLPTATLEAAEAAFSKRYPAYNPGKGLRAFMQAHWGRYTAG